MVTHPGTASGSGRIRPLNRPRPLRVEAGENGRPIAVYLSRRHYDVEAVLETWRIDDEWWRQRSISRVYWRVSLEDGRTVTAYRNLISGRWAIQAY